jgi:3-oxoacyl-[acyl-carrier-protein] synthase-3
MQDAKSRKTEALKSWADYPSDEWLKQSIFAIKQDTKILDKYILVKGAESLRSSFDKHNLDPEKIDHVLATFLQVTSKKD